MGQPRPAPGHRRFDGDERAQLPQRYGLPSHGISIRVITREMVTPQDFGSSATRSGSASPIPTRPSCPLSSTACSVDRVRLRRWTLHGGAELHRHDRRPGRAGHSERHRGRDRRARLQRPDQLRREDRPGHVRPSRQGRGSVGWVTMSERRTSRRRCSPPNQALNAARSRWPSSSCSTGTRPAADADRDRWFADGVHLTTTGQSEFALWLRGQALALATAGPGARRRPLPAGEDPGRRRRAVHRRLGRGAERHRRRPVGWGFFTVWPCGSPMPPDASHVNFLAPGAVEPNSVLAPVDATGEVCVWTYAASHVLVDVNGWFTLGFEAALPSASSTRAAARAPRSDGCRPGRRSGSRSRATVGCRRVCRPWR